MLKLSSIIISFFLATTVSFAGVFIELNPDSSNKISINGKIKKGEYKDFERKLKIVLIDQFGKPDSLKRAGYRINRKIPSITLNSPGGDLIEAMKIGHLIRKLFIETHIRRETFTNSGQPSSCSSACFFIFVSGIQRQVDFSFFGNSKTEYTVNKLGLHRPYFDKSYYSKDFGSYKTQYEKLAKITRNYLLEMGVNKVVVDKMFSIPSKSVYWLQKEDFDRYVGSEKVSLRDQGFSKSKTIELEEWIEEKYTNKYSFHSWKESLLTIHNPENIEDLINNNIFRRRLAFDELLAHQLAIAIIRNSNQKKRGISFDSNQKIVQEFIKSLPFQLTKSQLDTWSEINNDLSSDNQMVRLLQGDVGSGKTIVALLGMIQSISSGYQAAMMVPTSILANQHFKNISKLVSSLSIKVLILTGKDKGKSRIEKIEKN